MNELVLHNKVFTPFISASQIREAVTGLSRVIDRNYEGKHVTILCVLDGAFMFLSDLVRELNISVEIIFIKLKSYSGTRTTGTVEDILPLTTGLKGKEVLIVEDIVDTGTTLSYFLRKIKDEQPASLAIATLLLKEEVFQNKFPVQYCGIRIPDKFVVGYGMDYDGAGRTLADIYVEKK